MEGWMLSLVISLSLYACSMNETTPTCNGEEFGHQQNISKTLQFLDSIAKVGALEVKGQLNESYSKVNDVQVLFQDGTMNTVSHTLIRVVSRFAVFHPLRDGFVIQYDYAIKDSLSNTYKTVFVFSKLHERTSDFISPPLQRFSPNTCRFEFIEIGSVENNIWSATRILNSEEELGHSYVFRPRSIDIANPLCIATDDLLYFYSELVGCLHYK